MNTFEKQVKGRAIQYLHRQRIIIDNMCCDRTKRHLAEREDKNLFAIIAFCKDIGLLDDTEIQSILHD